MSRKDPAEQAAELHALLRDIVSAEPSRCEAGHVCVVTAHPDDETIGCGAQLARWTSARLVVITDGAPRDLRDAHAHGFDTAADYAHARACELREAMKIAEVDPARVEMLGLADQSAARQLTPLTGRLMDIFAEGGIGVVLTHAYEGGHPDHDAAAFAVHAACRRLRKDGISIEIGEMPLYRLGVQGMLTQSFVTSPPRPAIELCLSGDLQRKKADMLAAYVTQAEVLAAFSTRTELFRPAEDYEFRQPPNDGCLLYERHQWGLTGEEWRDLACRSLRELGLE